MRQFLLRVAIASFLAGPAYAADGPGPTQGDASSATTAIETVVVTAERRAEAIRDVPATVYAVTADQLSANGPVMNTGDLLQTVPGVRFFDLQSPTLSEISIRGSGSARATGADSGVGLFVNDAYIGSVQTSGRNFSPLDYFDIDRAEVIEGPQSALYGRDAEYGVVNLVHAKPDFNDSGYVDENFIGGLDQNQLSAVLNHSMSDDVAVRLGGQVTTQTGGFFYNPDSKKYYDSVNGWLGRAQVRYRHGPLDVDLELGAQNLSGPAFATQYHVLPGTLAALPLGFTQDEYVQPHTANDDLGVHVENAFLLASYQFSWATLTSTTMARYITGTSDFATAGIDLDTEAQLQQMGQTGLYPLGQASTYGHDKTLYEDLHLTGAAFDDRLNWVFGGELLAIQDYQTSQTSRSPCTFTLGAGICGGTPTAPLCYLVLTTSTPCPSPFPAVFGTNSIARDNYHSEAIYGSASYEISPGLKLEGAARYTADLRSGSQYVYNLYTTTPYSAPSFPRLSTSAPSYSITLSYLIPGSWHDLVYAKMGSANRVGGLNFGVANPAAPVPFIPTYDNEYTTSYEVGLKGNVTSQVFVTLIAYMSRTGDAIAQVTDGCSILNACGTPVTTFNVNAGTVHARGIEMAASTAFDVGGGTLSLSANAADQTATYVSLPSGLIGLPILGSSLAENPHWTASATLDYLRRLDDNIAAFFHMQYHGQWGGVQDTVTSTLPRVPLESHKDITLRTGLDYDQYEVAFVIQNLANEHIYLLRAEQVGTIGATRGLPIPIYSRWIQPRTFGFNVNYKW